jgi:hypothetical protein
MLVLVSVGGFDTFLFGVRIRSNDPAKPRLLAELAFLVFAWLRGLRRTKADLEHLGNRILAVWPRVRTPAMWALAGGVFVLGVLKLGPYAGGSDSYGYVSQVDLWLNGHPFIDQPWMDNAPWPKSGFTFTPLGYMEDPSRHAIVPTYSPGLPFLMALIISWRVSCDVSRAPPVGSDPGPGDARAWPPAGQPQRRRHQGMARRDQSASAVV